MERRQETSSDITVLIVKSKEIMHRQTRATVEGETAGNGKEAAAAEGISSSLSPKCNYHATSERKVFTSHTRKRFSHLFVEIVNTVFWYLRDCSQLHRMAA